MYRFERNGKMVIVKNCGGKKQEELHRRGWWMVLPESRETLEELYDRLVGRGYTKIKMCWTGTRIPGIHDHFAYVKI